MPRRVDPEQRRRDILRVTFQILGEDGLSGLSFRSIAERLGGSTTMVTHYFASQSDLLEALALAVLDDWEGELAELETSTASAVERLWVVLNWLVPKTEAGVEAERTRIVLLREGMVGRDIQMLFTSWDSKIRQILRERLRGLVPAEDEELRVDLFRSVTNGLTLSILEHPGSWPDDRIEAVLERAMKDIDHAVPIARGEAPSPRDRHA